MGFEYKIQSLASYLESCGYVDEYEYLCKLAIDEPTEAEIVAATLIGEGGGEIDSNGKADPSTMKACYTTIKNRMKITGKSAKQIVLEKEQYTWWNDRIGDIRGAVESAKSHPQWGVAIKINAVISEVEDATHYYNPDILDGSDYPYWAKPFSVEEPDSETGERRISGNPCWIYITKLGKHTFGKDKTWSGFGSVDKYPCIYSAKDPQKTRCNCNRWPDGTDGKKADRGKCREFFKIKGNGYCY